MAMALALLGAAPAPTSSPPPGGYDGVVDGDKARVTLTLEQLQKARADAAKSAAAAATGKPTPRWEYKTQVNCTSGNTNPDVSCGAANVCTNGQIQSVVLRRLLEPARVVSVPAPGSNASPTTGPVRMLPAAGPQGHWSAWGLTCFPEMLPGNTMPSMAQIRQAFREVKFTKGDLTIQPVGNVTLVNLPTYFEATWPDAGVSNGEIDRTTLLGFTLEIEAIARSLDYHYGDGNSSGPTTSLGGPHPTGDIRWTYKQPGTMTTRVDTVYGGRFRLNGSPWMTIPDTVTIQGTPVTLTVKEAKARLYDKG